jgi:hypothetical protein
MASEVLKIEEVALFCCCCVAVVAIFALPWLPLLSPANQLHGHCQSSALRVIITVRPSGGLPLGERRDLCRSTDVDIDTRVQPLQPHFCQP